MSEVKIEKLKRLNIVSAMQWEFCKAVVECKDQTEAARRAGYKNPMAAGSKLMNPKVNPKVVETVSRMLAEQEKQALMSSGDVLRYMQTVMLFNPFKYFTPGPDGSWLIAPDELKKLPDEIACFIEKTTLRVVEHDDKVMTMFSVDLVSKAKMTELVAKHMLKDASAGDQAKAPFDWEGLHKKHHLPPGKDTDEEKDDPIEKEIKAVAALPPHKPAKPSANGHAKGESK